MLFTKNLILVFMSILFSINTLQAQTKSQSGNTLDLSLEKAIEMSLKESEDMQIKQNEINRMEYRYDGALASVYPHLRADLKYDFNPKVPEISIAIDPSVPPQKVSTMSKYDFSANLTLEQVIYNFGRVSTALKAADNARKISGLDKEAKQREVSYNTAVAYISVLLTEKSLEIAKGSYENAKLNQSLLEQRYSAGRIPKRENIKVAADIASRIPGLKSAESNLDLANRSLKTLTGLKEDDQIILTDSMSEYFPKYELDQAMSQMKEVEPTLKLLEKNLGLSDNIAVLQKSFYYPAIDGFATYGLYGQSGKVYVGSSNIMNIATLGIKISIPIWNGGETGSNYHQALVDKMNAGLDLKKARKGYELELRNAISKYYSLLDTY